MAPGAEIEMSPPAFSGEPIHCSTLVVPATTVIPPVAVTGASIVIPGPRYDPICTEDPLRFTAPFVVVTGPISIKAPVLDGVPARAEFASMSMKPCVFIGDSVVTLSVA
jgi:hypothetical protein